MVFSKIDYYWEKFDLNITHDSHTAQGLRVHLVKEQVVPCIMDNALICPNNLSDWAIGQWVKHFEKETGRFYE